MGEDDYPYRSLSSVGRVLLPIAEEMHSQGIPWRRIANNLEVSYSAIFVWRKVKKEILKENEEYQKDE